MFFVEIACVGITFEIKFAQVGLYSDKPTVYDGLYICLQAVLFIRSIYEQNIIKKRNNYK
jgi:hypothetical protein